MSELRKIDVEISGVKLTIRSDEPEEFVQSVAEKIDGRVREMMTANRYCTKLDAVALCAIDYCGSAMAAQKQIKNLEAQIALYAANVARLKAEFDALKSGETVPAPADEAEQPAETATPDKSATPDKTASAEENDAAASPISKIDTFRDALRSRRSDDETGGGTDA